MDNVELLKAKDAIFRLIGRYCICFLGTDNNYYMSDYFDYAIERSFDVLGFDRDEVPLMDFCQAWEDNNRKLWAINLPDEEYRGSTARDYYNIFVKSYKRWADSNFEDAEVVPVVHGGGQNIKFHLLYAAQIVIGQRVPKKRIFNIAPTAARKWMEVRPLSKCHSCKLRYVCEESAEWECTHNGYRGYMPEDSVEYSSNAVEKVIEAWNRRAGNER